MGSAVGERSINWAEQNAAEYNKNEDESTIPTSPFAEGSPVRYPLDYPICSTPSDTGILFVPLRIRISGAGIPDLMRVMSLRKQNPAADGCSIYAERRMRRPGLYVVMEDSHYARSNSGWQSLDLSGKWHFSATACLQVQPSQYR